MPKKKSVKGAPKGLLTADFIERVCAGLALAAEEELRDSAAWEDWSREAAEAWHGSHEEGLRNGLAVKAALREASVAAKERAAVAARQWAASWLEGRIDVVQRALPSREEYERLAAVRPGAAFADNPAGREDEVRGRGAGRVQGELPSAPGAAAGSNVAVDGGLEAALVKLVSDSAADALSHGRELATLSGERRGAPSMGDLQKETREASFAMDAGRSIDCVRSQIGATALAVLQDSACERSRALADTISRQLALDATCGRLRATLEEVRTSGRSRMGAETGRQAAVGETSIFWREVRRAAARLLTRQDVHRLVGLHV